MSSVIAVAPSAPDTAGQAINFETRFEYCLIFVRYCGSLMSLTHRAFAMLKDKKKKAGFGTP
jgi:hypothetical protein